MTAPDANHDETRVEYPPERAEAIHRALLSGLLGNVGVKGETHEYAGPRGRKFSIFPGSGLFKRRPAWVMSAEVVETSKTYARNVAPVRPEWIERLAQHLVKRSYADPHWQSKTAHVVAYEKVTLYGLVLVPRRLVHYGPIDPPVARHIFIDHALVEGDFRTHAEFFKHNRDLVQHVETLEAKGRRRDLLADPQALFAFYDSKLPPDAFNGPMFEKWRRWIERDEPRLLFMTLEQVMKRPAPEITPASHPDQIKFGDMTLPLAYQFEPNSTFDGVTVTVPLAGLS